MQGPDIVQVSPEKAEILRREMLPLPYVYRGLTVQGVSPTRLTPRPNENIEVPDEVGAAITARLLVRKLIEPRTVIAMAGHGPRGVARTVRGLVRAEIMHAGLAQLVANINSRLLTPTAARHSDEYMPDVDMTAYKFGRSDLRHYRPDRFEVEL